MNQNNNIEKIKKEIEESIKLKKELLEKENIDRILSAALMIKKCLENKKKVLLCGNGGSAADCQHFAGEMVGRFKKERKPYPFISLTTDTSILTSISNDYSFKKIFERQVECLGEKGDILICFSTSGESENILLAAHKGKKVGMEIISFTGKEPNSLSKISSLTLSVPSEDTPRIQEVHCLIYHIICSLVE
ncbi:MAG TPA: SIS domain-containing protein [bacterium]|nr:SIS domain-containing protein [bacterium]